MQGRVQTITNARIVFNFSKPAPRQPLFLSFQNTAAIFHEMGHALEALFIGYYRGDAEDYDEHELDTCEFFSQFTENFAYEFELIARISRHWKTGKSLPKRLFQTAVNYACFSSFCYYAYHIKKAAFDLNISRQDTSDIKDFTRAAAQLAAEPISFNPFIDEHVFSDRLFSYYTNNFYSYLYSEALAHAAYTKTVPKKNIARSTTGSALRQKFFQNWRAGEFHKAYAVLLDGAVPEQPPCNGFKLNYDLPRGQINLGIRE